MAVPYSQQQALDLIRKILTAGGYIAPSKRHARGKRMAERDVDMQDLEILLLESGTILRDAEWDHDYQNYKYRVEGKDEYGDDLTAIVVESVSKVVELGFSILVCRCFLNPVFKVDYLVV